MIVGELANRYSPNTSRPSVMTSKSKQRINHINILNAVIEQVYVSGADGSDVTVYLALPPLEVTKETKDELNRILCGTYQAVLNKLGQTLTINITAVKCYPESYLALAAFFFEFPSCVLNQENATKYGTGYLMSLDIGASTTDVYIGQGMKPMEKSGQTIKTGGNVIEMEVANGIRQKYGFDPTHELLYTAIKEGRLPYGNSYVDISEILRKAKREFARAIVSELQNYFRLIGIPLQAIRTILVSGGGSLVSSYTDASGKTVVTCESVSEFITNELLNIVEADKVVDVQPMPDARTANVRGLYVRYMTDVAIAQKAAQQNN